MRASARALAAALELPPPTPEQIEVIEAPGEPTLVVAGAGAGKTETMAARVVWLIVNGLATPESVVGLTFTRKAAQQLAARIRRRLSTLANAWVMREWDPEGTITAALRSSDPDVSTYHAYAGRLIADYGLLLPVEPSATLLSETELWQMAYSVVGHWEDDLATTKTPAGVTEAVLTLYGELAEHLVTTDQLLDASQDLYDLIDNLPPGAGQRPNPSQKLRKIQEVIDERRALIPLVERLAQQMRDLNVLDFGSQMSLAATLVQRHPEVVANERRAVSAVLLDEYQDTGHSQRILLSTLFGTPPGTEGPGPGIAVTAVGDPIQSIYGWRGASAANLPRFTQDFRRSDGEPARRLELLTSWRNPRRALDLANETSAQLRARGVPVSILRPRDDAPDGAVELALTNTIDDERRWVGQQIENLWNEAERAGNPPPTTAILVRRNQDSAALASELTDRGIPAEVVGIGGLLYVPEIVDVVAMMSLMADPMAGSSAMRLLTGARWRLGAKDLAALWKRAQELAAVEFGARTGVVTTPDDLEAALDAAVSSEAADQAGLGDAIIDPGAPQHYSPAGFNRIKDLGEQLTTLRRRIGQPLPELVAEVERVTGVAVEAQVNARRMRGQMSGREHLDAFAQYVADYAARADATLPGLLGFLAAASDIEKGLEPGRVEIASQRVQILTVHSAKGLEWDVVALVHLSAGIFPGGRAETTWLGSPKALPPQLRGDRVMGTTEGFPDIDLYDLSDRKQLEAAIEDHKSAMRARRDEEDRRLLYVAVTRAKHSLLLSGHHWSDSGDKPRGPSEFLVELHEIAQRLQCEQVPGITVHGWAADPDEDDENPMTAGEQAVAWPADPLGATRGQVHAGAQLVLAAMRSSGAPALFDVEASESATTSDDDDVARWTEDVRLLLAERNRMSDFQVDVAMPQHLSVSEMVELERDPQAFGRRLRRPAPLKPNAMARRGTAFHAWIERRYGATRLLDTDELPGAADAVNESDADLNELREKFLASAWADRTPQEVETPFETVIGGKIVRGRIDAVFADDDGGATVVDWKTGSPPTEAEESAVFVQLAAYRVAWAELTGIPLEKVRAAFHYVRSNRTVAPTNLPDAEGLAALLRPDSEARPDS